MSVQTQIERLNAIKERMRTNLVAQGVTVPDDTVLSEMAEMVLSVAGADGVTFTPALTDGHTLSWTNDGGLENPAPVDLKRSDFAPIISTTASRTLAAGNESSFLYCTNSSAITITVPSGVFAVGTEIEVSRCGAGTVTFAGASGVTINSVDGKKTIANQYGVAVLKQVATNVWLLAGDLE